MRAALDRPQKSFHRNHVLKLPCLVEEGFCRAIEAENRPGRAEENGLAQGEPPERSDLRGAPA